MLESTYNFFLMYINCASCIYFLFQPTMHYIYIYIYICDYIINIVKIHVLCIVG